MTKYRITKLRKELGRIPNCKHSWCTSYNPSSTEKRKADIKKAVREALDEHIEFKQFLEENHAKGEFIKEVANRNISKEWIDMDDIKSSIVDTYRPIDDCLSWYMTTKGIDYWKRLNQKFVESIQLKKKR